MFFKYIFSQSCFLRSENNSYFRTKRVANRTTNKLPNFCKYPYLLNFCKYPYLNS